MLIFYLDAGKLGLKEFLTECLQPAPLSPGGTGRKEDGSGNGEWQNRSIFVAREKIVWFLCAYRLPTGSKEQRDPPYAGLHELGVDALHVSSGQAVFVVSVADGVNPREVRHVAEQHHPLEERLLGLMTTCQFTRKWILDYSRPFTEHRI